MKTEEPARQTVSEVGLYHLLSSHLPSGKMKVKVFRHKQVLEERAGLSIPRTCLESYLPGGIIFWQSQCGKSIQWLIIHFLLLLVCAFILFLSVSASCQSPA